MASSKGRSAADQELDAIGVVLRALDGLDGESIQRVLDYVFSRLSIATPTRLKSVTASAAVNQGPAYVAEPRVRRPSIRDLKEEKRPESANQMAALVAYYLSEQAEDDHKEAISTTDLERYFKQAGFKLPKTLSQTLSNAAAAGYLDSVGNGTFKLNAVGYNLVVHGLPRTHRAESKPVKRTRKKPPGKKRSS